MSTLFMSPAYILVSVIFFSTLFSAIAIYAFTAMSLYDMAKNNGYEDKAILAWIPVVNLYLIGLMSGDAVIFKKYHMDANTLGIMLVALPLISGGMTFLSLFSGVAFIVLLYYAYNNLYRKIDTKNADILTMFSIVMPIVATLYLFMKKDVIFDEGYIVA